ncbi:hypothetical protein [Sphingobacterium hotanense]|uniref:Uncharacterized protein n=1 Tax=Sphingobacterium hotanense TaxID=649196 RepID=A0ABT7NQA7_9SPHI|nr:hypothetical protein [Sphingobacterium hotanense]MDM1049354.1 hypothetical protein [Sphingobacterium hotanense]
MGITEQTAFEIKASPNSSFIIDKSKRPSAEKIIEFLDQPFPKGESFDRHVVLTKDGFYSFLDNIKNHYEDNGFIIFVGLSNRSTSFNKNEIIRFYSNHSSR